MTSVQGSLGFLTDERRLNVAITRARHFMFVIGNAETLIKNEIWSQLVSSSVIKAKEGGYFRLTQKSDHYDPKTMGQVILDKSDR